MKENKYDNDIFFEKYSQMERSKKGLSGAGEWETLKALLPDFQGQRLLDLGCGYGWHCIYAMEHGAVSAVGVDISGKMLEVAREKTEDSRVRYVECAMAVSYTHLETCINNEFRDVRFSYDMGYPVEITMDIYTNDTARRLGLRCCEVRYAQAEEDRYRYNVKDDRERFVMTVK